MCIYIYVYISFNKIIDMCVPTYTYIYIYIYNTICIYILNAIMVCWYICHNKELLMCIILLFVLYSKRIKQKTKSSSVFFLPKSRGLLGLLAEISISSPVLSPMTVFFFWPRVCYAHPTLNFEPRTLWAHRYNMLLYIYICVYV